MTTSFETNYLSNYIKPYCFNFATCCLVKEVTDLL
jgi:hypothetical protein